MEKNIEEVNINELNIDEIKAKYPKLYEITVEIQELGKEVTYYFKRPMNISLNRYIKDVSKKQLQAGINFVKENIIEEQEEIFLAICEEYPGIAQGCVEKLLGFLGFTDNVSAKKL